LLIVVGRGSVASVATVALLQKAIQEMAVQKLSTKLKVVFFK